MHERAEINFSQFGKSFQEKLVLLILKDRAFADQIEEVLDNSFLELKYLQVFVKKIFSYKKKYNVHPSMDIMTTIIRSELDKENELIQKQIRDFFVRAHSTGLEIDGEEYVKETSLDFCKKQKLKEAIMKSVDLLQQSSFDEISTIINDALKLGVSNDFGYDYIIDFEKRFMLKARNPIATGWDVIDRICGGGLGKGELGVAIAPTGAGKSMLLVHLGAEALKRGKTVVHYTLELQDTTVASRYDSCLTGVPIKDLFSFKEMIYESVQTVPGKLIIKEYPTKTASVNTVKIHLEKLSQRGVNVDMIIVDYADLLRVNARQSERRFELESIYEDLRALAQINECPIWTASQTNRSGLNAEVITMESISEAYNKCFVADFIFSLSRTIADKNANGGRIYIAKNRNGIDGLIYPVHMDTSIVKINILDEVVDMETVHSQSIHEQKESLKKKYKKFRVKD